MSTVDTGGKSLLAERYQTLSTTIVDLSLGIDAQFFIFPWTSSKRLIRWELDPAGQRVPVAYGEPLMTLPRLERELAWAEPPLRLGRQVSLLAAMQATLESAYREEIATRRIPATQVETFALDLVWQRCIPFRESPITGVSLADLLAKGSGPGAGGLLGALASDHHTLLLFLTVPGGMVVGGAAYGVATALQEGLHERVLTWIRNDPPDKRPRFPRG